MLLFSEELFLPSGPRNLVTHLLAVKGFCDFFSFFGFAYFCGPLALPGWLRQFFPGGCRRGGGYLDQGRPPCKRYFYDFHDPAEIMLDLCARKVPPVGDEGLRKPADPNRSPSWTGLPTASLQRIAREPLPEGLTDDQDFASAREPRQVADLEGRQVAVG